MSQHIKAAEDLARTIKGGNPIRASLLLFAIIAFIALAVVWAANTELDAVTRGDGRIVPSGEIQSVQPSEPGVIVDLHVAEGDRVARGDALVTLDPTALEGELERAERRIQALELRVTRLNAEIAETAFDVADATNPDLAGLIASERALFIARQSSLRDEIAVLQRQQGQRRQGVLEAETRLQTAEAALALVEEEIDVIRPLVDEGVEPRTTLIALLGRQAEASGRVAEAGAALAGARTAVNEIDDRILAAQSAARAGSLDQLTTAEAELAELRVMLPTLQSRLTRSVLIAPTDGVVNRILMQTIGALARAGEALVEIVPVDDEPLVEAYLRPSDVAFVSPGQDVRVSITAYDASRYGTIDGAILRVGADAITHPTRDEEVFVVEVRTSTTLTDADGNNVDILPGMIAQVDILSGKRTVLDYITEPVVRVKQRALRD